MGILEIQKRIIKNFKILGLTKVLSGIASALTIFILARELGVEKFGILSIAIAFVEVLNIVLSLRIWEATTKFLSDVKQDKEASANLILNSIALAIKSSAFACFIICFFAYQYSNSIFNYQIDITKIIIIYSLFYVVFTANEVIDGILRTFNDYKRILFNNVTSKSTPRFFSLAKFIIFEKCVENTYVINFDGYFLFIKSIGMFEFRINPTNE